MKTKMEVSGYMHKMTASVILLTSLNCVNCELTGAVVGLSINIACKDISFDTTDSSSPPFWIINGTVYELFSIPRHFPFIPVVTHFASLKIPFVSLALNNTTFQCARFGENGMENGTLIQLQVQGEPYESSIIIRNIAELVLNYQELRCAQDNRITISWVLNDTCSERFQVQGYTLDTGEPVLSPEHVFDVGLSAPVVLPLDSNISYKLVAFGENASLCTSNRDIYNKLGGVSTESRSFNFTQCFIIPRSILYSRGSLNFVWPSRAEGRSCVCPVHNSSAGHRVFESCVEGCRDAVLTPTLTKEGHVCLYNLNSTLNGSLFHFVCSTDECGRGNPCFLQTIISSYIISYNLSNESFVTAPTAGSDVTTAAVTTPNLKEFSHLNIFLITTAVVSSSAAIIESVIIAVMVACILKFTKRVRVLEAAHAPSFLRPSLTVPDPDSTPVYEEIKELSQATRAQDATRRSLKEIYEFTTCPAYTFREQQSNNDDANTKMK